MDPVLFVKMTHLTHLECTTCGEQLSADMPRNNHCEDGLLFARYDIDRIRRDVAPRTFARESSSLWRYAALLPAAEPGDAVTLGEGWTPLLRAPRLAAAVGLSALWVKDEGRNPSGTFKDRGASVALTRYRELGVDTVALNSSGNAGGSWALYAARAGIDSVSVLPIDVQASTLAQCAMAGARTYLLENWHDSGRIVAEACMRHGWFNACTLREPYRTEGKKTMGLEIAEQFDWDLPDVIVYPVGGGLGAIAIYKAFAELRDLGWISAPLPRLFITQYEGCAPVVKAYREGKDRCEPWGRLDDVPAGGLKSPNPSGGPAVIKLLHETGGGAFAVSRPQALAAVAEIAECEGIFACPESATTLAGLQQALAMGSIGREERVVIINTGAGLKSIPALPVAKSPVITRCADVAA
jgi:threonine synthase